MTINILNYDIVLRRPLRLKSQSVSTFSGYALLKMNYKHVDNI